MRTRTRPAPSTVVPPRDRSADDGPFALPPWLDGLSDRWWSLTPRRRTITVLVVAISVLVGAAVRSVGSPHGAPTIVLVAAEQLAAGTPLAADLVERVRWPADLVPDGALDVASGTLRTTVPAGAAVTAAHVTEDGVGGLVGDGRAAVPVPVDTLPHVPVGTRVQVVATAVDGTGQVLSDDAEVVSSDGTSVWLGVDVDAAAEIAAAGLRGTVAVAVLPS